jgi:predicted membrane channel-forming protein YqfA (hemolysin III family)
LAVLLSLSSVVFGSAAPWISLRLRAHLRNLFFCLRGVIGALSRLVDWPLRRLFSSVDLSFFVLVNRQVLVLVHYETHFSHHD